VEGRNFVAFGCHSLRDSVGGVAALEKEKRRWEMGVEMSGVNM
jgi:hypothetical protein